MERVPRTRMLPERDATQGVPAWVVPVLHIQLPLHVRQDCAVLAERVAAQGVPAWVVLLPALMHCGCIRHLHVCHWHHTLAQQTPHEVVYLLRSPQACWLQGHGVNIGAW